MFEIAELSLTYSQYQGFKRKIHFIYTNMITMTCLFGKPIYIFLSTLSIDYLSTRLSTLLTIAIPNKTTCISVETVLQGSTVNMNVMQPIYNYIALSTSGYKCLGIALLVGKYWFYLSLFFMKRDILVSVV